MIGVVDNLERALLPAQLRHPVSNAELQLEAWVDTGFTGELVVPQARIAALGLPVGPAIQAWLADGSDVALETRLCALNWFGTWTQVELIVNSGEDSLLGIGLLNGRELNINYRTHTVTLL